MSIQKAQPFIKQALKLIEQCRFRYGTQSFFSDFIDHWAFQQSGLYPPAKPMPDDLKPLCFELSNVLSEALKLAPSDDVFAPILCELGASKRGGNYFPTPPHIADLMAALVGDPSQYSKDSYYEPCCGTGVLALKWLHNRYMNGGIESLECVSVHLEDIDSLMVKCAFIQIIHFLSNINGKVKELRIERMDTLSMKSMGLLYYATAA
ncbi:MAG TPA: restriction endonuclease subunit M [Pseudoalteromonas sp.]|jgi:hypothetical protein|nr:restriction endonuclease subunit M [Pseudoalteromonas sp.]|tara:strand:+ start:485 stop:1105 length:621 start_codon:yes stop_codon:yes gene_type:complete